MKTGEPIGTGLGMWIVKTIIHNYGGEISLNRKFKRILYILLCFISFMYKLLYIDEEKEHGEKLEMLYHSDFEMKFDFIPITLDLILMI